MAVFRPLLRSFVAGQLAALLLGRTDIEAYEYGAAVLQNLVVLPLGPLTRRPGTEFIALCADAERRSWLIAFRRSRDQAYTLEFGHQTLRFFSAGVQVASGGGPLELATPWTEAQTPYLRWAQSADVMRLVEEQTTPRKLTRTSHTAWSLAEVEFVDGPWLDLNTGETVLTASAVSGSITIAADADSFVAGDVGRLVRFEEASGRLPYDLWETGKSYGANDTVRWDGRVYQTAAGGTAGSLAPEHDRRGETQNDHIDGSSGVDWTLLHDGTGYAAITGFTDAQNVAADVVWRLPASAAAGTQRWRLGAWSSARGYPAATSFHEGRWFLASSPEEPDRLWGSKSFEFEVFTPGGDGNHAIVRSLNAAEVETIRWLLSREQLFIGTDAEEWRLRSTQLDEGLTPDNANARPATAYGSAPLPALKIGNAVLFVEEGGRRVRELVFNLTEGETGGFTANDLLLRSYDLGNAGIVDWAFQRKPWSVVWMVLADGGLLSLTYERNQNVSAPARHLVGGSFTDPASGQVTAHGIVESIAVIPGDPDDEVWLTVKRTVNGASLRTVEKLADFFADDAALTAAFFVDCGLTGTVAVATTRWEGFGHLIGETLKVLADGAVHPAVTVDAAGGFDLQQPANTVTAGLGFASIYRSLPLAFPVEDGPERMMLKTRIARLGWRLYRSLGLRFGRDVAHLDEKYYRPPGGGQMDAPPPLFTGSDEQAFAGVSSRDPDLTVYLDDPLPLTLTALGPLAETPR